MEQRIIDLHCDTITIHLKDKNYTLQDNSRNISEDKLKAGGALAQCFALFVPLLDGENERVQIDDCYRRFLLSYDYFAKDLEINKSWLVQARTVEELDKNKKNGLISAILTLEDGTFIGDDMSRLEEAYEKGARALALTWNTENRIGYPNSADPEKHKLGLKPFGFDAVARMNELGMLVDVSHLSEGGFWDVVRCSKKPFVATHSCSRVLCNHQRNLTDEQLKAIGNAGGIVGINFCPSFIVEKSRKATNEQIFAHMCHIADKAGIDALALGSDFDGIGNDIDLEVYDYAQYPAFLDQLGRYFTPAQVDKIASGNALRVFKEVWR